MSEETPIETLVERTQGGDRRAAEALMLRFRGRLEGTIRARVKQMGLRIDPEEVFQEVCLQVLESLERLEWRGENAFYGWLSKIARNVSLGIARSESRLKTLEIADRSADGTSPSRLLRREERFNRFETKLRELSPDHRKVIFLARIEGLSMKEIGEQMDRSPEAAKQLLSRALAALGQAFGKTDSYHLPDRRLKLEDDGDGA